MVGLIIPRPRSGCATYRRGRWFARITLSKEPKGADGRTPRFDSPVTREGEPLTSKSRSDETYAIRFARRLQDRYDEGTWNPERREEGTGRSKNSSAATTVADWCDRWLAGQTYSEAGRDLRRTTMALALPGAGGWRLGDVPLGMIVPNDIAAWLAILRSQKTARRGTAPAQRTVRNTLDPVARALRGAVFEGLLAQDPTAVLPTYIRPHAVDADPIARRGYRLSRAEVETLLGEPSVEPRWAVMWHLLVLTGMRVSEATALKWDDLLEDPLKRRITVTRQVHHRTRAIVPLKTRNCRDVPEHQCLHAAVEWWRAIGWSAEYGREPKAGDFVVPCRGEAGRPWGAAKGTGGPLWQQDVHRALQRDLLACGIRPHRVHDFRHTLASLCADAGMEENVAARWTHMPTGTTSRHLYSLPSWERQCTEMRKLVISPSRRWTVGFGGQSLVVRKEEAPGT